MLACARQWLTSSQGNAPCLFISVQPSGVCGMSASLRSLHCSCTGIDKEHEYTVCLFVTYFVRLYVPRELRRNIEEFVDYAFLGLFRCDMIA